jgi:hypothetical protein
LKAFTLFLHNLNQEALEVLSFGEGRVHGMVGGLSKAFDNLHATVGIGCGVGDNLLEQVHFHKAGATERSEHAAFGKEFHCK